MPCGFATKIAEVARQQPRLAADFASRSIKEGKARYEDFSIRELADRLLGDAWKEKLNRYLHNDRVQENSDAIDASSFVTISGQLLVDRVREGYETAPATAKSLFQEDTITNQNLGPQIEPYLSMVANDPEIVNQGQEYPRSQFTPQYVTMPAPEKFGLVCEVTMEMIWSDKTKQAFQAAESVGLQMATNEEERCLRVLYGLVNPYNFNGVGLNTYLTAGSYINDVTGFTLTDWTSINTLEQLLFQMVDPVTGKNINIVPTGLVTLPALRYTARRIMSATDTRSGDITTGAGNQTVSPSPLDVSYPIYSPRHARRILVAGGVVANVADSYVLLGDFKKAFVWRQVYPLQLVQAPAGNNDEFHRDVALKVKASSFGVPAVGDPRFVVRGRSS